MYRILLLPLVLGTLLVFLSPSPQSRKHEREKRFALALKGKPWVEVFEWLANVTDKVVIGGRRPMAGICNVTTLAGNRYTIPEVIDLLNEDLLSDDRPVQHYLLPRERSIMVVPWDEKSDDRPHVISIEALLLFPRTAPTMVQVNMPLKRLEAEGLIPRVKKMMGAYGDVVAIADGHSLLMIDQARNLLPIVRYIRNLDESR